ncbi:hypothetical protein BC827DRAFT_1201117 [Russula dissimulans]|nr:hypothetical protein BC827DRAFT_1201117 [Russula dissimulans]
MCSSLQFNALLLSIELVNLGFPLANPKTHVSERVRRPPDIVPPPSNMSVACQSILESYRAVALWGAQRHVVAVNYICGINEVQCMTWKVAGERDLRHRKGSTSNPNRLSI